MRIILMGALLLSGTAARAFNDLPPATGTLQVEAYGGPTNDSQTLDWNQINNFGGQADAVAWPYGPFMDPTRPNFVDARAGAEIFGNQNFTPALVVVAKVDLAHDIGNNLFGLAESQAEYSVKVVGPPGNPVPVDYTTEGGVSLVGASGSGFPYGASALIAKVYSPDIPNFPNFGTSVSLTAPGVQTFEIDNGLVYLTPGKSYDIQLTAEVNLLAAPAAGTVGEVPPFFLLDGLHPLLGSSFDPSVQGYAYADPAFRLDLTAPAGYSIEISPNVAPVPEPSAWGLLGAVGLSALGRQLIRRRLAVNA